MAVSLKAFKEYLGLMPGDDNDDIPALVLSAAQEKAKQAGVPEQTDNAHYDLFIYALASTWYDFRGMETPGNASQAGAEAMQRIINQFVLELRRKG